MCTVFTNTTHFRSLEMLMYFPSHQVTLQDRTLETYQTPHTYTHSKKAISRQNKRCQFVKRNAFRLSWRAPTLYLLIAVLTQLGAKNQCKTRSTFGSACTRREPFETNWERNSPKFHTRREREGSRGPSGKRRETKARWWEFRPEAAGGPARSGTWGNDTDRFQSSNTWLDTG